MVGSMQDWAALDSMFQSAEALDAPPKPSYGRDGPVKAVGMSPGMIGPPKPARPPKKKPAADPHEIWTAAEVAEELDPLDLDDGRGLAEYDLVFKQNVTPEDFFLGVDPLRHAGVACSDALVLKLQLPGAKMAEIDLDVRPTCVRLSAPKHKAKVHLPERVDEQKGTAKWDAEKHVLTVTLPIKHDWESKLQTSAADDLD
ncbi:hypothetical protein AB1Y20_007173 [Prymnesium parvum]|uniref:PIH1D1/2/3 CS-like domain-containing protein n=1 Tax=Prymnesium parvum TaxID=97485 RepID=A0AB34IWC5_PRYPA